MRRMKGKVVEQSDVRLMKGNSSIWESKASEGKSIPWFMVPLPCLLIHVDHRQDEVFDRQPKRLLTFKGSNPLHLP
jgi:hypothetical protein